MYLSREEEMMLEGELGPTVAKCMELLVALGKIYNADKLVPVASTHISGVSYKTIGDAGVELLEDLAEGVEQEEKPAIKILSTLNPSGMDLKDWKNLGVPKKFARQQERILRAYIQLGATPTCSCTPYLCGNLPRYGQVLAWAESSAVIFANSVLGARTNREGGPAALAAAICGRTPRHGFLLEENRVPTAKVVVLDQPSGSYEYSLLGAVIGSELGDEVPLITGLSSPSLEELRSLGASMAAMGANALYHVEGVTPEASTVSRERIGDVLEVAREEWLNKSEELSSITFEEAELVCIGCPHLSLGEVETLARCVESLGKEFWACTSREVRLEAEKTGLLKELEKKGVRLVCDTCMVVSPLEEVGYTGVVTNSAKAARYLPTLSGIGVVLDSVGIP